MKIDGALSLFCLPCAGGRAVAQAGDKGSEQQKQTMETDTCTASQFRRLLPGELEFTLSAIAVALLSMAPATRAQNPGEQNRVPELPATLCDSVNVPAGNRVSSHFYALGAQVYQWSGSDWVFIAPDATLFADACYEAPVGRHYSGPTWEAADGSTVQGIRLADCTPNRGAIAWLRLGATTNSRHGIFAPVTYIQRINTIGGTAPATAGAFIGDEARVPYTAEYYFYVRTKN